MPKTSHHKNPLPDRPGHKKSPAAAALLLVLLIAVAVAMGLLRQPRVSANAAPAVTESNPLSAANTGSGSKDRIGTNALPTAPGNNAANSAKRPPFDSERFYAGLSRQEKGGYLFTCLEVRRDAATGKARFELANTLALETLATTPRQKKIVQRMKEKCQRLAGFEERLYKDIVYSRQKMNRHLRDIAEAMKTLAVTDPQKAAALFLTGLNSEKSALRSTLLSPALRQPTPENDAFVQATLTPLNQQLGLDFFHPQQRHGARLLSLATQLASCQRHRACGPDSLNMLSYCLSDQRFCGIDLYALNAQMLSPADMDYVDQYMQFLLSRPEPPADWEDELLAALGIESEASAENNGGEENRDQAPVSAGDSG